MKYLVAIPGALLLLAVSCTSTLYQPIVSYAPVPGGDTLRLTWGPVPGAAGYYVCLDSTTRDTVAHCDSFDVTVPTRLIQVSAFDDSGHESSRWELNTLITQTDNILVCTTDDAADTLHAFYFDSLGVAWPAPIDSGANIDFVLDTAADTVQLRSPNTYTPPYDAMNDATVQASTSNFDSLLAAPAPGAYNTTTTFGSGVLYAGWLDPTDNGWSDDDHFVKIQIVSISPYNSGAAVTINTGYQPIGGLRWLLSR
jgi:hypothetical protein